MFTHSEVSYLQNVISTDQQVIWFEILPCSQTRREMTRCVSKHAMGASIMKAAQYDYDGDMLVALTRCNTPFPCKYATPEGKEGCEVYT